MDRFFSNEAFLYCWTDKKYNKLYVGIRKGSPNDGYICSSKLMLQEYNERISDFSRIIIASGTYSDLLTLEAKILKSSDAKHNPDFYNMHNGDGKFYNKQHTKETKSKITGRPKGGTSWNKGLKGYKVGPCSEERKIKIGNANRGRKRPDSVITLRKMISNMTPEQEQNRRIKISKSLTKIWAARKAVKE